MYEAAIHNKDYHIAGNEFSVTWKSYDFTQDVSGIADEHIRQVMLDSGVMYIASADPKIRVSNLLDLDLQGLSAIHEELCMEQQIARCVNVESLVIDAISDPELRVRFINMRLRMFGALCMLDRSNQEFEDSRHLLAEKAGED